MAGLALAREADAAAVANAGGDVDAHALDGTHRTGAVHVGQGSSITVPEPPQREHGWEIENIPWPWVSMPRPSQRGQTVGVVPGLAPVPWQVGQMSCIGTDSGIWAPEIA